MVELEPSAFGLVRPLFGPLDFHLAVQGILAGSVPARLYVDNSEQPQVALAVTGQRYYLAGASNVIGAADGLRRLFRETLYPQAIAAGHAVMIVHYSPQEWDATLSSIMPVENTVRAPRQYYVTHRAQSGWRIRLPEGVELRLVDKAILAEKHLKNLGLLTSEMCSERPSVEDFLDKSFGVCLICDSEIAGWCLSEYNTRQACEVGIETVESYRRRGFGTAMACALVECALSRGITQVGWDCWARNAASAATALKAGFEKAHDYPVWFASLPRR
jgi:GNAT superfamily N-acetyltransferase